MTCRDPNSKYVMCITSLILSFYETLSKARPSASRQAEKSGEWRGRKGGGGGGGVKTTFEKYSAGRHNGGYFTEKSMLVFSLSQADTV